MKRTYIVSDLHGSGEVYDSIMGYLENISLIYDTELYINGDLIDRGLDSFRMLQDVKNRIEINNNFKINYLGGNHELLMYQAFLERNPNGTFPIFCDWLLNGGYLIEGELEELSEEKNLEFKEFIGNLEIYKRLPELIDDNEVLLVHAAAPKTVLDNCDLKINNNNWDVEKAVWTRKGDYWNTSIGKEGYITIIGHTPVTAKEGFIYDKEEKVLNIDGGCAVYGLGMFECSHVPIVEITDNKLNILVFNHDNEIVDGYYYSDNEIHKMNDLELDNHRMFIDHSLDNKGEEYRKLIKEFNKI